MKRFILTFVLLVSFLSLYAADLSRVQSSFKKGDASLLKNDMDTEVEMILPSVNKKCPGADAVKLLDAFFKQNKPTGFSTLHQAEKTESGFYIGKLTTSANEFRVNITYRINNQSIVIQSIRIETK